MNKPKFRMIVPGRLVEMDNPMGGAPFRMCRSQLEMGLKLIEGEKQPLFVEWAGIYRDALDALGEEK